MTPKQLLTADLNNAAETLRATSTAFAIATVVRTLNATSAKPGAKALVLPDGTITEGWIGGGCICRAVGRAAVEALRDGQPKFVSLRPGDVLQRDGIEIGAEIEGAKYAKNGCPSQGSMDIFVEPVLPQPTLVIIGNSPVAHALLRLADGFDFNTLIHDSTEIKPDLAHNRHLVVVASQGKADVLCLADALEYGAEYVAFVGSNRKFAALVETLVTKGHDRAVLTGVTAPAGLHIDAVTPDEIALSILAQVVQTRRRGHRQQSIVHA